MRDTVSKIHRVTLLVSQSALNLKTRREVEDVQESSNDDKNSRNKKRDISGRERQLSRQSKNVFLFIKLKAFIKNARYSSREYISSRSEEV